MKILTIHADYVKFKPTKKAIASAEPVEKKATAVKECLVAFTAVEKQDEKSPQNSSHLLAEEIRDVAKSVKAKNIVLYPYAHLSPDLASPDAAIKILTLAEGELKKDYKVTRAPFGWYKEFEIKAKGHPLSELSRSITVVAGTGGGPEQVEREAQLPEGEAVKAEKKLKSKWFILEENGKIHELSIQDGKIKGFDFSKFKKLETFATYEMAKVREVKEEPPHVKLMKKLQLVDYEPSSDPGNLRFYPKGRLIKALLEEWVTKKTCQYGAVEVETPIMYDYEHPALKSYLNRFPARQYTVQTPNKRAFLRFSACFGQFIMAHDATISYKQLPFRFYEMTRYSFRAEQRGELTGLRRLRAFTMPDCHALVKDIPQAKDEMRRRFMLAAEVLDGIGLKIPDDFEFGIRVTKDFFQENKDFITELVKRWGKPALLEMWDEKFFYFVTKYEWNFVDNLGKASALTTDQIDVENGARFGITYYDADGKKKNPIILHLSPSGAIERVIYALLEKAHEQQKNGKIPSLPLWLCPTQIRIIPVSDEKHLDFCLKLADYFKEHQIRADVDDNIDTVNKRIFMAEEEWIPYILVVGNKEQQGNKLTVRIRETAKQVEMSKEDLVAELKTNTKDMPYKDLPLPVRVSMRPSFLG